MRIPVITLFLSLALNISSFTAEAARLRVLFIGNSYTYVNDLPARINELAMSGGDTLVYSSSTPGGYTFQQHSTDANTLSLIAQGNWDFVVLQEQSQLPSFPNSQVTSDVYPYSRKLDSLVHVSSPCAKTLFYMTWGRKNGDAQNCPNWPPVCTYTGMDSLLQDRYKIMALISNARLSPVAATWRRIRNLYAALELYQSDESHPSEAGTYASACTFYSVLFQKNPALLAYNYTLNATDAANIRAAAKAVAYDSLSYWNGFMRAPLPDFTTGQSGGTVSFNNLSQYASRFRWTFGDGQQSTQAFPQHTYAGNGTYNACLTAYAACDSATACKTVRITNVSVAAGGSLTGVSLHPNPAKHRLFIAGHNAPLQFRLYDLAGRNVKEGRLDTADRFIDISGQAAGSYFLLLTGGQGEQLTYKVVLE